MTQAARFRDLMRRNGMVVAPGAYDCITARLIERAGYDAVYMTGAGTAATLGYPDFGLVTMTEMVDNARRIADRGRSAGHRRRRYRLRQRAERRAHGARVRGRRGRRHPYRGPGLSEKMRPSRRQGDRAARRLAGQDPRRRCRAPQPRLHGDRAHRRARRRRVRRGDRARQRRDRGRRRHGVCRGAADAGRGREGAATGARAVPA